MRSQWVVCFLRDAPIESAWDHYKLLLPYKDMIVGVGLDSNEYDNPPSRFYDLYQQARDDGFKLTCHCDVAQPATHENIRQVASMIGGTGAERIDHGLDAASDPDLVKLIKEKGTGMTLCPWAYVRHHTEKNLFAYLRILFDEGIIIMISSDSPAYVESQWLEENLKLIRLKASFTDEELEQLMKNAVEISWATVDVKRDFRQELEHFVAGYHDHSIT